MKIDNSVSISGLEKGIKVALITILILLSGVAHIMAGHKNLSNPHSESPVSGAIDLEPIYNLQNYHIAHIYFEYEQGKKRIRLKDAIDYELLLALKPGEPFNYKKNRENIAALYKTGLFSDVKVEIEKLAPNHLDIYYVMSPHYTVGAVKIGVNGRVDKNAIRNAVFSLRKDERFKEDNVKTAQQEIRMFLNSRGYFNPEITSEIIFPGEEKAQPSQVSVDIIFNIKAGPVTIIEKISLVAANNEIREQLKPFFTGHPGHHYIPIEFQKAMENARKKLKEQGYSFPEIKLKENFLNDTKTRVNLEFIIKPGYRYEFKFLGMEKKIDLIATVWDKKVFEKWAEKESTARLLYYLKNKGYLNAEVESSIEVKNLVKYVTFTVKKNKRYALGQIQFTGNQAFTGKKLTEIVKTDDQFFDRHFYLRFRSLRVDQEVLRLFYYFNGFPSAVIRIEPLFRDHTVDIRFVITEGKKFTVDTLLFNGHHAFSRETLSSLMQTQVNGPFVQQKLNEDLERIRDFYYSKGFDNIKLTADISPGNAKSILVNVEEGQSFRLGNLIIIGASEAQEKLIRDLFTIKPHDYYNRMKIDSFKTDIENSAIFSEIKIVKIGRTQDVVDVLIKVTPDTNKYYGFGFGGEWAVGAPARLRGTFEYQQRNIFNSYSALSGVFQLAEIGKKINIRGAVSFDTPYLFRRKVNSELKVWADSEQFPSYSFTRLGASESIVQKFSQSAYFLSSLLFYRTRLNELNITPTVIDRIDTNSYTTALRLSFVREKRDDPFNPTSGDFFSSDFKLGLLMLPDNSQFPFLKFQWSYQKLFKFLKHGVLAFSIRNGLADGELPVTERFFAGGVNTFRGTKTDRLGPMDPLYNSPKGGNAMLLLNLEATFPIPFFAGNDFYYTVFADMGNLWEKVGQFSLTRMEKALGFGLKLKTQLGPLRMDFAWHLSKREEGNFRVHLGIGNVF